MAKKTPQQRLQSLNNKIAEEQVVVQTRTKELIDAYSRKDSLLVESVKEAFDDQFNEQYHQAISGLEGSADALPRLSILLNATDRDGLEDILDHTRDKLNEIMSIRIESKQLRHTIEQFMLAHRSESTEADVSGVIDLVQRNVRRLQAAIEERYARAMVQEIEAAIEAVEPLLGLDTGNHFTQLPLIEQQHMRLAVAERAEEIAAVDNLARLLWVKKNDDQEQSIRNLFQRGEELIKQKIEALYADDEVEHDLGLGYWLSRSHELNNIVEDSDYYDGRDPQSILNKLTTIVAQLESEDRL